MKSNFYGVKAGRIPGIYTNWNDCNEQIHKFPNALYKRFNSYKEANDYFSHSINIVKSNQLVVFIGGARYKSTLGFGNIYKDFDTQECSCYYANFSSKPCQKVAKWAPFFCGCFFGIQKAISDSYKKIVICTNEDELKSWSKNGYGDFTHMAKKFKEFLNSVSSMIDIVFSPGRHYSEELTYKAYKLAEKVIENKDCQIENPLL